MNVVAQVFAGLTAMVYVPAFVWETLLFPAPACTRGVFHIPSEEVTTVRLWSFCQGFYNLFLASGTVIGWSRCTTGTRRSAARWFPTPDAVSSSDASEMRIATLSVSAKEGD